MDLLVLGSSGRCGQQIVRTGLERGHRVTALVREGSEARVPEGAEIVVGEANDEAELLPLLRRHTTVLSGLGLNRDGLSPWSRLRSPPDLVERVARTVRTRAGEPGDFRFIWISAGGVGPSERRTTLPIRTMIGLGNVGVAYADLRRAEAVLDECPSVSVPVRPVTLLPGDTGRAARGVSRYGLFSTVRRGSVARHMLDIAEGSTETATLIGR